MLTFPRLKGWHGLCNYPSMTKTNEQRHKEYNERAVNSYTIRTRGFILMVTGQVASVYVSDLNIPVKCRVSVDEAVTYILRRSR